MRKNINPEWEKKNQSRRGQGRTNKWYKKKVGQIGKIEDNINKSK